jgi:hypothetical protein
VLQLLVLLWFADVAVLLVLLVVDGPDVGTCTVNFAVFVAHDDYALVDCDVVVVVVVLAFVVGFFPLRDVDTYDAVSHMFVYKLDGNDKGACAGTHQVLRDFGDRLVFENES